MTGQVIESSSVSNPEIADESKAMPVGREERIFAIDALRGFALLGILVMNIASFGLPEAAYFFPVAAGGSTGWNYASWFIAYSLCEGKMRAMFSMMFGASVYLLPMGRPAPDARPVLTDALGHARVELREDGVHAVLVLLSGFFPQTRTVLLETGCTGSLPVTIHVATGPQ